jgi:hypothetical protein
MERKHFFAKSELLEEHSPIVVILMISAILFVSLLLSNGIPTANATRPGPYERGTNSVKWAGYNLHGSSNYGGEAIAGYIYTIDPYINPQQLWYHLFEYVGLELDYSNNYWLAFGYSKDYWASPSYSIKYAFIKNDMYTSYGWGLSTTGPSSGSTHRYYLMHPYGYDEGYPPNYFLCDVESNFVFGIYLNTYDPYCEPVDQFACVETGYINWALDGTHFSGLATFAPWRRTWKWYPWTGHVEYSTNCNLWPVSNTEFRATG